jgi:putative sterol carrier protein
MHDPAFLMLQNALLERFGQYAARVGESQPAPLDPRREDAIFVLQAICHYLASKGLSYLEWEIECAERTLEGWERSSQKIPRASLPLTNDCGVWRMTSSDTKKPSEILESLAPVIAGVLGAYGAYLARRSAAQADDSSLNTFDGIYEAIDEARKRKDDKVEAALLRRLIRLVEAPIAEPAAAEPDEPCCATANLSDRVPEQRPPQAARNPVETIARAMRALPSAYKADGAVGWNAVVQFEIKNAGDWTIKVADGKCATEKGKSGTPTCVVKTDAATYSDIVLGKEKSEKAFLDGKISATNLSDIMKFSRAFDMKAVTAIVKGLRDGDTPDHPDRNFSDWIVEQQSAEAAQGPVRTPPAPSDSAADPSAPKAS